MSTLDEANDFGRYLQQYRRDKEITLEEVSQATKIRLIVLQQIENEDLKALPTPTITKGFLRAYADAVGADKAEALKRYEAVLAGYSRSQKTQNQALQVTSKPVWGRLLLAIILIALLIALTLIFANRHNQSAVSKNMGSAQTEEHSATKTDVPAPAVKYDQNASEAKTNSEPARQEAQIPAPERGYEAPVTAADKSTPGASPIGVAETGGVAPVQDQIAKSDVEQKEKPEAEAPAPEQPAPKLVLQVSAVELTYLKITSDDAAPKELMMRPEQQMTFEAKNGFQLLIGNAAGIRLKLNGQPVPVKGPSGKVVHLKLP
ncbi:MAG: DUF4115 domain-containing protein [Desulfobacteraceae bacterium]|nr:DUF4115 domain-containing protein [Desulfobacteraceae bacterium]